VSQAGLQALGQLKTIVISKLKKVNRRRPAENSGQALQAAEER